MNAEPTLSGLRSWLIDRRTEVADAFDPCGDPELLLNQWSDCVDELLRQMWLEHLGESNLALLATGGYGRRELHPASDIDLLVLTPSIDEQSTELSAFLTQLWDLRLDIGHRVQTIDECAAAARDDLNLMTSLLEARLVCGNAELSSELMASLGNEHLWPVRAFFRAKLTEQIERHARFDDTAYNLEPNIKSGPGGLRDIQTMAWILQRAEHAGFDDLVNLGLIEEDELKALLEARRVLWAIRFQLHQLAGRKEDRLLFAHQVAIAPIFGFTGAAGTNQAVERFMQWFYRNAIRVRSINRRVIQAIEGRILGDESRPIHHVSSDFESVGGLLRVRDSDLFRRQPKWLVDVFHIVDEQREIRGIDADTESAIRSAAVLIDDQFRAHPEHRKSFLRVWSHRDVPATLTHMHELEILGRYLPAFGAVTGRMQFDLFHVYTVDQHTLMVLRNVRRLLREPDPGRFPMCGEIGARLRRPELLYVAAFFHDIGKGRGGDHSVVGAVDARRFCENHGLSSAESTLVEWLVQNHLIMSVTAQKRDIADPDVVNEFAHAVEGRVRLSYLYLLTMADIAGTSPKLWNSWKASLLAELYRQTRTALSRGLENPAQRQEWIEDTKQKAHARLVETDGLDPLALWQTFPSEYFLRHSPEQVVWHTRTLSQRNQLPLVAVHPHAPRGATEILVYARNRDGTFASIAWVLGRLALNILDARLFATTDGHIIDTFLVIDNTGQPLTDPATIERMLTRLHQTLVEPDLTVPREFPELPPRIKPFWRQPLVRTRNGLEDRTELTLECADRPGLIGRVALVFLRHHVRVHSARIATFGERAEDEFVLSDQFDRALSDDIREELECDIKRTLANEDHES